MKKIDRPETPDIGIYTEEKFELEEDVRQGLLQLIDPQSVAFKDFIPRLKDKDRLYTKAERETLRAIYFYSDPANFENDEKKTKESGPSFSVYKDDELKEKLEVLFNSKCAYCESKFSATSNADIEHFRPKKAFNAFRDNKDEKLKAPGYYWLAADWNNLLWSCSLCNRRNNLDEPNEVGKKPLGKKNRFPLSAESQRVRSHNDDLTQENDLLLILDPCSDDPQEHLEFPMIDQSDLGIVRAKLQVDGKPSPKGNASIPLYGLNRVNLVAARLEEATRLRGVLLLLLLPLQDIVKKKEAGEDTTAEELTFNLQKEVIKGMLKDMLADSAEYLSMKDDLIKEFEERPDVAPLGLKVRDLLE